MGIACILVLETETKHLNDLDERVEPVFESTGYFGYNKLPSGIFFIHAAQGQSRKRARSDYKDDLEQTKIRIW